jgi:HSP20 family protein
MSLIRYNPMQVARVVPTDLGTVFQRFFGDATGSPDLAENLFSPRVDVREEPNRFVLALDLPGVDPKSVDIQLEAQVLTLKGERPAPTVADGAKFSRVERAFGHFYRRFVLPDSADLSSISATGAHGVLEITVAKKAEVAPRKIEVI